MGAFDRRSNRSLTSFPAFVVSQHDRIGDVSNTDIATPVPYVIFTAIRRTEIDHVRLSHDGLGGTVGDGVQFDIYKISATEDLSDLDAAHEIADAIITTSAAAEQLAFDMGSDNDFNKRIFEAGDRLVIQPTEVTGGDAPTITNLTAAILGFSRV